ncbi:MAG: malate/lactate/ureidoglycolate dehydrogenase [Pseudomonadota bacterium]
MSRLVSADTLTDQCARVVRACGSSEADAQTVASNLVMANLSGHDSHGVGMLPRYVDAVLEGGLIPDARIKVVIDSASLLTLNGQRGFGQVVGEEAMQMGMSRAHATGSCIMALAEAHHLGRIGHFAEMAVAEGLVSLHFVNVKSRPIVAPWGGADGRYGTNPCCIGIPLKGRDPFVLDFATSRVAQGKMRVAHNKGEHVEAGLLMDEHGKPTTDPGVVVVPQSGGLFGALMPFGEHKGYGLAVACELLGGALTGGGTWHQPYNNARAVTNSMLTILIDPAGLGTRSALEEEAMAFVHWLKDAPPAEGFDAVQLAGEPERAKRIARSRQGIELDEVTLQELVEAARKVGQPFLT